MDDITGYETCADFDEMVSAADAQELLGDDWEGFLKRNRINGEQDSFFLEKVKKEEDVARLKSVAKKSYTGWIDLSGLTRDQAEKVKKEAGVDNLLSQWNTIPIGETNDICSRCVMSWDKGRGCIGAFGPNNSLLPEIAKKYGCSIVSKVPELAETRKKLSPEEARQLSAECKVLRENLPVEGKVMVRRYSGVVDRMETVADLCASKGVRLYFL